MALEASGVIVAVCTTDTRGGPTAERDQIRLVRGVGIVGDGNAGSSHRQVNLVTEEAAEAAPPGATHHVTRRENLVTRALDLSSLSPGRRLRVGASAVLQITQRDPARSFARVLRNGLAVRGDTIATNPAYDTPRFAILTLSDTVAEGTRTDESGHLAASILGDALGVTPLLHEVLADDQDVLKARLITLADHDLCDLIVTTGGTGLSPRDVTPEATLAVIDREVPGIAEAIRAGGLKKTPHAMLSRGVCGQRGSALIVNLSGSPRAVREQLEILLPVLAHVLTTASGVPQDCGRLSRDAVDV